MQADISKLMPKCITCGSWNTPDCATLSKLTMPKGMENTYPAAMPTRMEASFKKPLQKWFKAVTTASVKNATSQLLPLPVGGLPARRHVVTAVG